MLNRRELLLSAAAGVVTFALPAAAEARTLSEIKKSGVIRISVPQDFPPFGYVRSDLKLQGYDICLAEYIAKELGVKPDLIRTTSANRIPYMQSGKADIVISTLGKNAAREKVIDFSIAYGPTFIGVYGPASVKVSKPSDMKGHSLGVTRGAFEDQMLTPLMPSGGTLRRYEDNSVTAQAYLSGQVELIGALNVIAGALVPRAAASRKPELKFLLRKSPCFVGLPKGNPALKAAVDKAITKAFTSGEMDKLCKKFMNQSVPKDMLKQEPEVLKY